MTNQKIYSMFSAGREVMMAFDNAWDSGSQVQIYSFNIHIDIFNFNSCHMTTLGSQDLQVFCKVRRVLMAFDNA